MNKNKKIITFTIVGIFIFVVITILLLIFLYPYKYDYKFESSTVAPYSRQINAKPLQIGVDIPAGRYQLCAGYQSFTYYYADYYEKEYKEYLKNEYSKYLVEGGEGDVLFKFDCIDLNLEDNKVLNISKVSRKPVYYYLIKKE